MSRSNPNENGTPNPATRWFEWNGETGTVRYYDREAKKNIDCGDDFTFMLLDQLGGVRGWHDASQSGIYSNEVKDTRQSALVVRAFKGGTLAEGFYKDIKDRVNTLGGQFVATCYIAFKLGDALALGALRFKGAALGAWMEFTKAHRADLYNKAIRIHGFTEGKKGRITFRIPVLSVVQLTDESNRAAVALDKTLQAYLKSYLARTTKDQVETPPADVTEPPPPDDADQPPVTADDIPF